MPSEPGVMTGAVPTMQPCQRPQTLPPLYAMPPPSWSMPPPTMNGGAPMAQTPNGQQHAVHVHIYSGETLSVRVGNEIQQIQGPATVRMVSSYLPRPLPIHVCSDYSSHSVRAGAARPRRATDRRRSGPLAARDHHAASITNGKPLCVVGRQLQ